MKTLCAAAFFGLVTSVAGQNSPERTNVQLGLIVGCSVGGLVLAVLILCLFLILCRPSRRRQKRQNRAAANNPVQNGLQKHSRPPPAPVPPDLVPPGIWAANPSMGGVPAPFYKHRPPPPRPPGGALPRVPYANGSGPPPGGAPPAAQPPMRSNAPLPPVPHPAPGSSSQPSSSSQPPRPRPAVFVSGGKQVAPPAPAVVRPPLNPARENKETAMDVEDAFSDVTRRTDGRHQRALGEPTAKVFSDYREPADAISNETPLDVRAFSSLTTLDAFSRDNTGVVSYVYQQGLIPRVQRTQSQLHKGPSANRPVQARYGPGRYIGDPATIQEQVHTVERPTQQPAAPNHGAERPRHTIDRADPTRGNPATGLHNSEFTLSRPQQQQQPPQQPVTRYPAPLVGVGDRRGKPLEPQRPRPVPIERPAAVPSNAGQGRPVARASSFQVEMFASAPSVAQFQSRDNRVDDVYAQPHKIRTAQQNGAPANFVSQSTSNLTPVKQAVTSPPPPDKTSAAGPETNATVRSADGSRSYSRKVTLDAFRFLEDFEDDSDAHNTHM